MDYRNGEVRFADCSSLILRRSRQRDEADLGFAKDDGIVSWARREWARGGERSGGWDGLQSGQVAGMADCAASICEKLKSRMPD
jgi:hypothetical protein